MKAWRRIEPTTVTKVGWRTITTKTFELGDGTIETFDTLHPDGWQAANVLALTPDNRVILARQFRPGPERVLDELPGGFVDPGESPETAALRELKEETGYVPSEIHLLGAYNKDSYVNGLWYGFLATGCVKESEQALEGSEDVEVITVTIDELLENARRGNMTDLQTVLLAYSELKNRGGTL